MPFKKYIFSKVTCVLMLLFVFNSAVFAVNYNYTPTSIVPAAANIEDNACVTVTFTITDEFTVNDVNLGVNITHTYRGDLDMRLSSPVTADVFLLTNVGGGDNNLNVLFDSDSANVVPAGDHATAPDYVNIAQPENATALNDFDGEVTGVGDSWVYVVCDDANNDIGTVNATELRFDGTPSVVISIAGLVFRDYNANSIQDANEPGIENITLNAYDDTNALVATGLTDANGDFSIPTGAGTFRVETVTGVSYLQSTVATGGVTPEVVPLTFVAVSGGSAVKIGLNNPGEYTDVNADMAMAFQTRTTGVDDEFSVRVLKNVNFPAVGLFDPNGPETAQPVNGDIVAKVNETGALWGLAYDSLNKHVYVSAIVRRHAAIGAAGTGAIYQIDLAAAPGTPPVLFTTVAGTDNGAFPSNATRLISANPLVTTNDPIWDEVGKVGLGDLDISDDGQTLYTVNLFTNSLVEIDIANPAQANHVVHAITNPFGAANCADVDVRSWGLGQHDGKVYVGSVCTTSVTQGSYISEFDPVTTTFTPFHQVPLDMLGEHSNKNLSDLDPASPHVLVVLPDPATDGVSIDTHRWRTWITNPNEIYQDQADFDLGYPAPILSDIIFDENDGLILGFIDRTTMQVNFNNFGPDAATVDTAGVANPFRRMFSSGDLYRVCKVNGLYVNEGAAGCAQHGTQGDGILVIGGNTFVIEHMPHYMEYFDSDVWLSDTIHQEVNLGALAYQQGSNSVVSTSFDPDHSLTVSDHFNQSGIAWSDTVSGDFDRGIRMADGKEIAGVGGNINPYFSKSGGMGDVEFLNAPAPIEIGNYIWNDADGDGIQDPSEVGIPGVTVKLYLAGVEVGSAVTNATGYYYFGGSLNTNMLAANTILYNTANYQLRVLFADAGISTALGANAQITTQDAGVVDVRDSDGDNGVLNAMASTVQFATTGPGQTRHNYDFGFKAAPVADLSLVKNVDNSTPFIGSQVVFTITVTNDGPADATNFTVVDNVPNGFSAISAVSNSGTIVGSTITWSNLSLVNGASVNLSFTVTVESSGTYSNLAQITSSVENDSDSIPNNGVDTDNDGNTDDDIGDEDDGDGEAVSPVIPFTCVVGNNDIGGLIFRDFNQNGTQDALEPGFGVAGMIVTAYDEANIAVATASVNANGHYVFAGIAGIDYRLELSGLPSYLEHGVAGAQSLSSVRFINAASCSADFTVNNPVDYCQADPDFIMSRFVKDGISGANSALDTILQFNIQDNGTDAPISVATFSDLGSTYGMAHLRKSNVTYVSSFFKRHSDVGPSGIGAIYKIDHTAANITSTFATLPGTDPRGVPGAGYDWEHDTISYVNIAKRGIGDIEISDDETQLFAVNLEDRNLYTMGIDANGNLNGTSTTAIPNPCASAIDYRPMGLGFNDGVLYVGVTCTAESTVDANNADDSTNGPRKGDKTELSAHIYSFNPTTLTFVAGTVLDIDLTYDRGCVYNSTISTTDPSTCTYTDHDGVVQPYRANWNPWQMDYDIVFNDKNPGDIGNQDDWIEYMQPLLSDIEFDNTGAMIIAIRDVNGDRGGHQNSSPNPADATFRNINGEGDILRACGNAQLGWVLENNGQCANTTTGGANGSEGPGGGEFYWYDNGPGGNGSSSAELAGHGDTVMGGLLQIPGQPDLITGVMDVHDFLDNGLIWLRNDNGQISTDAGTPKRLLVSGISENEFFGKGNGIGDLEALCDPAPIEIGNRVWNDTDGDGIQDADEPGIDGVTVTLICGVDSVSAITANGGQYYFNNSNPVNAGSTQALFMESGENCQISVDNIQGALTFFALTVQDADADISNDSSTDVRDSDASLSGTVSIINFTVEGAGKTNHSYDFGFEPQVVLIDFGDAPDLGIGTGANNYRTTSADNGPSHIIRNSIYMGAGVPDSEADGQPDSLSRGDDLSGASDEDGPQTILNFATGDTPTIQVLVTNQTGVSATLIGWIDYDGNGVFDDATESATSVVADGTMSSLINLVLPQVPVGTPAESVLRLRLGLASDLASQTSTGAANIGEIEDHRVTFNQDLSGNNQLCYVAADGGDRLVTTNPLNGAMDDTAAGLGNIPYTSLETIAWDLGNPMVSGDEVLYAPNGNQLVQLLPTPRTVIGTFNNGVNDSDGFAIDWQSIPPVYYGSGDTGNGHLNIFNFNPANANVLNVSSDIVLPTANTQIDDIAWDPINRRLLGVTNDGTSLSHLVQFDLTNLSTTAVVTASDCGPIMFAGTILQDTEGLTFTRPGELVITTGAGGPSATNGGLYKVAVNGIATDCSAIVGAAPDILPVRIGPVNTLTSIAGSDHEAIDCGLSFTESSASIGNRVWLDEDADGDQDAGEDGIGGVIIYLCRANAAPCNAATAVRLETTDANGGYLFEGLPILDYIVAVETSSLPVNLASHPTYDEDSGTVIPDNQTNVSLIRADDEHLTADFGYNWNDSPETQTPPSGAVGSIGDRIWMDADGDGVQDANEAGINSVTVNLYTDPDGDSIFDTLVATTSTDENGNYNFDGLVSGAYVVEVNPLTLPAGVVWTQTGDPDEFAQVATAADHRTTDPVILAPGDVFVNADFGYQGDAANTHSIGDTIFLDVNADGLINVGEPGIDNVTVTLLDSAGNPIAQTVTDANGQYIFSGLPDGIYSVVVTDTNNVLASLVPSSDPDATLDNKSTVNLLGNDNLSQDFGYKPLRHTAGAGLIGDTIFMDINGDGVQTSNEQGIEGVIVELIDTTVGSPTEGYPIARSVTDENGNYYFGNLPDGNYSVVVDISTLPNSGIGMTNTADPDGGVASQSENVSIAGGNVDLGQDFGYQVNTPNRIGGNIWYDNDANGTKGNTEVDDFEGVTINLLDSQGNIVGTTVTDANGNYQFIGLPDGTYTIVVTDESNVLAGHWLTDGTNDGLDNNSQEVGYTITVVGGQNNQTGDFGYYVNLASIGNIVFRDDNNDGMRNSATEPGIPLVPVTLTITYPNNDTVSLTTLTDGAGHYSFDNLLADDSYQKAGSPGNGTDPSYSISVGSVATGFTSTYDGVPDAAGFAMGTNNNSDNTDGEIAYPVKGAAELTNDFGFVPGATIGNRVWLDLDSDGIQDANEDGIANSLVQLTPPAGVDIGAGVGNPISTVTDTNGNYVFTELPLANGYTVTVTNPPVGLVQTFDEDGIGTAHSSQVNLATANEEHLTADFGYITPDGSVGDLIWADANGDGQQDPNELGLPNIDVYLCNTSANPCDATTPAINVIAMTTTDATGHYLFSGVSLTEIHNIGIDTTTLPAGYVQTGDPDGVGAPDNQTTVLALNTTNNINLDADFGYQPPVAGHSNIGDTIYQDLDGNGTQGAGEPGIPGVTVQLFVDTTANGIPDMPVASAITNANGNFLFPSLPIGVAYSVVVTDTNNILNNYKQTADPDAVLDNQSIISNLIMDRLDQDFGYRPLRKGNGIIGDRIFHDANTNGIQDAGDQGLEGVTVRIFDTSGNLIDSVVTDENGQYLFTGLDPSGAYTIVVDTSTLPNGGVGWNNIIDPDGTTDAKTIIDLSLVASGIDLDQDFGFTGVQSNTIEGTVWSDNDGNGLLTDGSGIEPDETNNGLENVTVELKDASGNIVATTTTDVDGNYSFTGLPDGTYTVSVTDKFNELANLSHTDGPNANDNAVDNNSQDDTGYAVSVVGGVNNSTADFGYQPVVTTPITLASFKASYNQSTGQTTIDWSTVTETGNIGFDLYLKIDGVWIQANKKLIPSKDMYSTEVRMYHFVYDSEFSSQWALVDVDINGKRQSHGEFKLNESYGEKRSLSPQNKTKWQHFNQLHSEKSNQRNNDKSNAINDYIRAKADNAAQSTGEGS